MMTRRNTADLPEHLVMEILSRVPAKSLARFRSISKGWNGMIKDREFAKNHSANGPRPTSQVIMLNNFRLYLASIQLLGVHGNVAPSVNLTGQFSLKDPLSKSSKEVDIRQVFHCDGLLLCIAKDNRLVVWNPCSGETRWIKPINCYKDRGRYALGKSSCNKYKILRMDRSEDNISYKTEYQVCDISSNSWRSVGMTRDWFLPSSSRRGVFFKGNTYWLAYSQEILQKHLIISFDFVTERFQSQPTPSGFTVAALSVIREEQLCLLTYRDFNKLDVWMASEIESTGVMSWTKFLTSKTGYMFSHGLSFLADEQNKVVVCSDNTQEPSKILHIVGEDRHIQVDHNGAKSSYSSLLSYVPTLVQITFRRTKKAKAKKSKKLVQPQVI